MPTLWLRRLAIAALVAVALGYGPYHLYSSSGLARWMRLRGERDALHEANLKLLDENRKKRRELDGLLDPEGNLARAAVERAARDELGLVGPGEIVYQLERPR